jgi:hypothetical protein
MVSTYTTNKHIEQPAYNDYVNSWNTPVNTDWSTIDLALGGVSSINVTGAAGVVTLTTNQYIPLIVNFSGTLSANVNYQLPSGVGGQWCVNTKLISAGLGTYTVTFSSAGGGASITISTATVTNIYSDGTNVYFLATPPSTAGGGNGQIQYNNSGAFAGSASFTFDGTNVTDTVGSFIDSIGNVRNVPLNNQTTSYTFVATDAGKLVTSTTGGATVPASIFSAGQNISYYNNSGTPQTITQGASVTLIQVGTGATGNRTLAGYGLVTIICVSSNTFLITGNGLT